MSTNEYGNLHLRFKNVITKYCLTADLERSCEGTYVDWLGRGVYTRDY